MPPPFLLPFGGASRMQIQEWFMRPKFHATCLTSVVEFESKENSVDHMVIKFDF